MSSVEKSNLLAVIAVAFGELNDYSMILIHSVRGHGCENGSYYSAYCDVESDNNAVFLLEKVASLQCNS